MITIEQLRRLEAQAGCGCCGEPKTAGRSFCVSCYYSLPIHMQAATQVAEPTRRAQATVQAARFLRENRKSYNEVRPRYARLKSEEER